jgi:hypothetical protein
MEIKKTKEIAIIEKKVTTAYSEATSIVVKDDESLLAAGEKRKQIKDYLKQAKEEKDSATKPLNDTLKTIRGWFAPLEESCEQAIAIIGGKMQKYQDEVEEKRRKAEAEARKKEEEAKKKLEEGKISEKQAEKIIQKAEEKVFSAPAPIKSSANFHTRVDRKVRFSDPKSLSPKEVKSLIDDGYLVWDEVKGRRDALDGTLTVGVEVYEQKSLI